MADWKQITARIRRARTGKDPAAQLSNLYEKTQDAMVAFELARHFETASQNAEAAKWYSTAAARFRRADWKTKAQEAANSMKITAQDMLRFGVIDSILREPAGGAHRDPDAMIATTGDAIAQAFNDLGNFDPDMIRKQRRQKFLDIGRKLG